MNPFRWFRMARRDRRVRKLKQELAVLQMDIDFLQKKLESADKQLTAMAERVARRIAGEGFPRFSPSRLSEHVWAELLCSPESRRIAEKSAEIERKLETLKEEEHKLAKRLKIYELN